jgi:hypothetical protein
MAATMSASCQRGLTMVNGTLPRTVSGTIRPEAPMMQPMIDRPLLPSPRRAFGAGLLAPLALAALLVGGATSAEAAPKKYHFELTQVTPKPEVKPDVAKAAVPRVEGQVRKAFESNPQVVAKLDGAPDKDNAQAYRKFLVQKGISGAYYVTVEVTEASEEIEPMDKPNSQRLVVTIAVHMLGETIPGRTIGFTGDGRAKIKQEVGKNVRPRDREVAWDQAAEVAIADAMTTVFKQLAKPQKK